MSSPFTPGACLPVALFSPLTFSGSLAVSFKALPDLDSTCILPPFLHPGGSQALAWEKDSSLSSHSVSHCMTKVWGLSLFYALLFGQNNDIAFTCLPDLLRIIKNTGSKIMDFFFLSKKPIPRGIWELVKAHSISKQFAVCELVHSLRARSLSEYM